MIAAGPGAQKAHMRPLLVDGRIGVKLMLGCTRTRIGAAVEGGRAWDGAECLQDKLLDFIQSSTFQRGCKPTRTHGYR